MNLQFSKVKKLKFSDTERKNYRHYKNSLEPFILSGYVDDFPNLMNLTADNAAILLSYVENHPAECSVIHNQNLNQTLYYYERESEDPSMQLENSRQSVVLKQSTKGGIDIFDDPEQLERELLTLQVTAIKHHVGSSNHGGHSRLDEIFGYGKFNPQHPNPIAKSYHLKPLSLTLGEAREILLLRAKKIKSTRNLNNWEQLIQEQGALYMKSLISSNQDLMDTLHLESFFFVDNSHHRKENDIYEPLDHPLSLDCHTYVAWLNMAEKGAGTRTHINIMCSHAYHVLLKGRKKWRLVHPLDRHLVTDNNSDTLPDLFNIDPVAFPLACYARIYEFTQEVGEAVFIPSDCLHCEISLSSTIAISIDFMDNSCAAIYNKQIRDHAITVRKSNLDALYCDLTPLTTVDLVLFTENVYSNNPDLPGSGRLKEEKKQDVYLLRSLTQFNQIEFPCSELGARVELEALQECFSLLGECLLQLDVPHYVVGVPKGYIVSRKDRRLLLYYNVIPETMNLIKETLLKQRIKLRNFIHWYECIEVTLPAIIPFHFTCSRLGKIPNYLPLSVLLGQIWPFERELFTNGTVNLGRIILDKANHPLGFIRTGSVWHYSRFYTFDGEATTGPGCCKRADDHPDDYDNPKDLMPEVLVPKPSSAPSFQITGIGSDLEKNPDKGWCRTFLFYCSSLLTNPITMHPLIQHASFQTGEELLKLDSEKSTESMNKMGGKCKLEEYPRILEFKWDVDMLEKYGMVSLVRLGGKDETGTNIKEKIVADSYFKMFLEFAAHHKLNVHIQEDNLEVLMAAVLFFLCKPSVVGYTIGTDPNRKKKKDVHEDKSYVHLKPLERTFNSTPIPSPDNAELDDKNDAEKAEWDTVCLTATAASALLNYDPASVVSTIVTRLCNWLCDIPIEPRVTPEQEREFIWSRVTSIYQRGTVEEKASISEVLKVKRHCLQLNRPSHSSLDDVSTGSINLNNEGFKSSTFINVAKLEALEQHVNHFAN